MQRYGEDGINWDYVQNSKVDMSNYVPYVDGFDLYFIAYDDDGFWGGTGVTNSCWRQMGPNVRQYAIANGKAINKEMCIRDRLSAMPGRIRFQLEKPIKSDVPFLGIKGVTRCRYNPRIGTLLCEYDQLTATEEQLLVKIGAVYAGLVGTALLHIKHSEEEGFSMAPSGYLALCCIALDLSLIHIYIILCFFPVYKSCGEKQSTTSFSARIFS